MLHICNSSGGNEMFKDDAGLFTNPEIDILFLEMKWKMFSLKFYSQELF